MSRAGRACCTRSGSTRTAAHASSHSPPPHPPRTTHQTPSAVSGPQCPSAQASLVAATVTAQAVSVAAAVTRPKPAVVHSPQSAAGCSLETDWQCAMQDGVNIPVHTSTQSSHRSRLSASKTRRNTILASYRLWALRSPARGPSASPLRRPRARPSARRCSWSWACCSRSIRSAGCC